MGLSCFRIVNSDEVNPSLICSVLQEMGCTTIQATYDEIVVVIDGISIVIVVQENYLSLETLTPLNKLLGKTVDFIDVVLKCNECNSRSLLSTYVKKDLYYNLLFCSYHTILFKHILSMPDLVYQLHQFASISKILLEDVKKALT